MLDGRFHRVFALSSILAGCSSAAPVTPAKPPSADAPAQVAMDAPMPTGPVAAPKSLLVVMRAHRPAATLAAVDRLLALPISLRTMVEQKSEGMMAHLELEASIDVAVALDPVAKLDDEEPKFFYGVSVPFKSVDAGLAFFKQLDADIRATAGGQYRVEDDDLQCDLLPTGGRSAARAVCSDSPEGLRELGAWMGRTLPLEPTQPLDLHARFEPGPLRERYLVELRAKSEEGLAELRAELANELSVVDPELLEAPGIALQEGFAFADDLDALSMSLAFSPERSEFVLGAELSFRQSTSWLTRVSTETNAQRSAPPEVYWRMPKAADSAMWGRSSDPARFVGIRRVARKSLAQGLSFVPQIPEADRQAMLGLLDAIPTMRGTWASASGTLPALPGGAPKQNLEKTTPAQVVVEAKNLARAALPWSIVSTEGDPEEMVRFLERGADVYARSLKLIKQKADEEIKNADPEWRKHLVEQRKQLDRAPKLKLTKNPPGLPRGTAALDLDITFTSKDVWELGHPIKDWEKRVEHPKGPEARGNLVFRVLVVPQGGGRYVWGYSLDGKALEGHVRTTLEGKAEATIASRTDLARLRAASLGGGFVSYARIAEQLSKLDDDDPDLKRAAALVDKLPNKGAAPVFVVLDGAAGQAPRLKVELSFEKAWMDDLTAAIQELVSQELTGAGRP